MIARAPGVVVASRYRLVRPLGVGGMGTVWLADDLLLDAQCALKLIDDDKAQSPEVRVRFAREAKVAAQLRGAHVVDVFEHGEWEGTPFIAMEYLQGEDLGTRLDRETVIDPASTYRIAAHVARALARAHAYGIVHRDLKPENVFLVQSDDGELAKVVDFGIAKHDAYSLRDKTTKTGSFLGTPYYVSPEQARGKQTDHRSDLWSLAVIVFQCMTGRPPFESEALGELMGLILYEDLPKPSDVRPGIPEAFDAWWERAAKRDRDERFQSAREFADSLGEALGQPTTIVVPSLSPRTSLMVEGPGDPALEELRETDAPFSRTRHSSVPRVSIATALIRHPKHWPAAARHVPRRVLVGGAVGFGLLAGGALT
ncbi:MAG TPA: serine/threonine-protein kinase, partial [Polyangiaceae bacterium]|nr:serine/threonine-protein kinase [Polyangiaceae bacterium]